MIIPELPADENQRLQDLYSYDILDSKPEADFDDLVELAAYMCDCPISTITLLDTDRQWFKAQKGLNVSETSRNNSFCSHAILQDDILEISDAREDERFHNNPLVTGEPEIRFYAGSPIISPAGYKLGTICVIDHTPKKLTGPQEKALARLANQVSRLIELRKKNKLIRQRSLEIISIKNNAITGVIKNNWSENKSLAYNLHEGLAQEIASCLMTLQSALINDVNRLTLLGAVKTQLHASLAKIKEMSYSISPLTTDLLPVQALIEEYIEKVAATFAFEINFSNIGERNVKASDKTAALIYIIEAWLARLLYKKEISKVDIILNIHNSFELAMEDDSRMHGLQELGDHVYASLLKEMAISEGGFVDISLSDSGKNLVKVTIPFTDHASPAM